MKLSKVEIQAFRIYDKVEDGTFDFTLPSGEAADFVSIYAPNGFGKTSFYDAVEWAFTNKVSRISDLDELVNKDKRLAEENGISAGHSILRNKNAADGTGTFVEVHLDPKGTIRNELNRPRKGSTDLNAGTRTGSADFAHLSAILLEQDGIDEFLRRVEPEQRYEDWAKHFGGREDEPYYKTVVNLIQLNTENLKELEKRKKKLAGEKFACDQKVLHAINEHITSLQARGSKLSLVSDQFDEGLWADFLNRLAGEIVDADNAVARAISRAEHLRVALSGNKETVGVDEYLRLPARIKQVNTDINELERKHKLFDTIASEREKLDAIKHELSSEKRAVEELSFLVKNFPKFSRIQNSIEQSERSLVSTQDNLAQLEEKSLELQHSVGESEHIVDELGKQILVLRTQLDEYPTITSDLFNLEKERATAAREKTQLDSQVRSTEGSISNLLRTRLAMIDRALESLARGNYKIKIETFDPQLKPYLLELQERQGIEADLMAQLGDLEIRIAEFAAMTGDLEKLLSLGLDIAGSTGQKDCPLCQHAYESSKVLLGRIKGSHLLTAEVKQLSENKKRLGTALKRSRLGSKKLALELINRLRSIKDQTEETIESQEQVADELRARIATTEKTLQELSDRITALSTRFLGLKPDRYLKKITTELPATEARLELAQKNHKQLGDRYSKVIRQIATAHARIKDLTGTLKEQTYEKFFIDYTSAASRQDIDPSITKKQLEARLSKAKEAADRNVARSSKLEESIKTNRSQVAGMSQARLGARLESLRANLQTLQAQRSQFESFVSARLGTPTTKPTLTKTRLSSLLSEAKKSVDRENEARLSLKKVESMRDSMTPFLKYWTNQKEMRHLDSAIADKERLGRELEAEKGQVGEKIQQSVREFFHEDLINRFYQAIDPHPGFKIVEFRCNFDGKLPTLDVHVRDEKNQQSIVPNLYFSAAQINVLSLSIFLARALKATDTAGRPIDYIFIDDPVQAMDSINILSTIDLLRSIVVNLKKQIILSTHDENFHNLLKRKIPSDRFRSTFIELETYGKVKRQASVQ